MSWRSYRDYYYYPPPSRPREAKGGIKAQSKQGAFGKSWWAQHWIEVLEKFGWEFSSRLERGRSYARRGQVLSIDIEAGKVTAKVQGSRPQPYNVTIKVKTLSPADGEKLGRTLAREALFAAKLLAGEMPQDIEKAFHEAGLSLFPETLDDLDTDCSCPDWSNPCKHIAAVYYLLGEEFDRDPFLIFKLRGLERDKLIGKLGAAGKRAGAEQHGAAPEAEPAAAREPLDAAPANFWDGAKLPAGWLGEVRPPPLQAALPKRLGKFPLWRGTERFLETLEPVYTQATARGQQVLLENTPNQPELAPGPAESGRKPAGRRGPSAR